MSGNIEPNLNIQDFISFNQSPYQNSWISIGNFDGVHLGHQAIIKKMIKQAKQAGNPALVVTFYPNPTIFFHETSEPFYLTTPDEKNTLLESMGVDSVITLKFDRNIADLSPHDFLKKLKEKLDLTVLVVGHNFTVGKGRSGTIPVIKTIGEKLSFEVKIVEAVRLLGTSISSTRIRNLLDVGQIEKVTELLGRYYEASGVVTRGSDRGSRIGLPTANILHWGLKKLPALGVYATYVFLGDQRYQGLTNIGVRPTFEEQEIPNIETHILGFDGNIYGEKLTLQFLKKIRDERKFTSVESFLAQIERDRVTAKGIFGDDKS